MTHVRNRFTRPLLISATLGLTLALSGCGGIPTNRLLTSVHQPEVSHASFTLDLTTGPGGLSVGEQNRLDGWFEAMNLRYGDHVAVDDPLRSEATRAAVSTGDAEGCRESAAAQVHARSAAAAIAASVCVAAGGAVATDDSAAAVGSRRRA